MPCSVHEQFASATKAVPLDAVSLGIVKAAVTRNPAPANRENRDGKMAGSATWLERFGAAQSLAVPVLQGARVLGVLAASTADPFDEDSVTWQLLVRLGRSLAPLMAPRP